MATASEGRSPRRSVARSARTVRITRAHVKTLEEQCELRENRIGSRLRQGFQERLGVVAMGEGSGQVGRRLQELEGVVDMSLVDQDTGQEVGDIRGRPDTLDRGPEHRLGLIE